MKGSRGRHDTNEVPSILKELIAYLGKQKGKKQQLRDQMKQELKRGLS